ncbi:PAS domain S-box-containing protein [Lutibacter agarilyticus]|uniref:histidine kinase n=1 Tax=Lutibacter agarilyticus TaxID=1109740 RepID=A0A238VV34_9FLAO|nr:PAS domain S-box protein [Lutibacter agarilyticus]SNR38126.1 PAS domain S-box-containing protein [Lutibacter agarilyticus]
MKEKETIKSKITDTTHSSQFNQNKKYTNFFEYAPVALFIEDFSEVKSFIEKQAKEANLTIEVFLQQKKYSLGNLHEKVIIKEVNATAVKLYKAENKNDLLKNLERVFTPNSTVGFSKLVIDILTGKNETVVETVNKSFDGQVINVLIKYNVQAGSEDSLKNVIVSVEDITERIKTNQALEISEKRYKESQKLAKLSSWFYDFNLEQLHLSDELYALVETQPKDTLINLDYCLSFIHEDDKKIFSDISIQNFLEHPNQDLSYRIYTSKGELKYIHEKRSVLISKGRIERIVGICQDITVRVLSEEKLNNTKKLLSNTLSSIQDGFVILDNNSNYIYINHIACQLLGRNGEDLVGKNIWNEFPEKEGDLFFDNYQKAFETKKTISFENYFSPWNRWFENTIIPSNDTILIFFRETTNQKESENKVKTAYNIINKSSSVAILCENSWDFPVVFASENSDKLFGYSSAELRNKELKIHKLIHPQDLESVSIDFLKLLKEEGASKVIPPKTFRIITKEGEIKWIEASIDVIKDELGNVTHIQGISADITQRKKTEDLFFESNQRLQDQFNNTPLASIIWDLDFNVLEWNNSAQRIFGYSLEEALGKNAKELILPTDTSINIQEIWANLLNQKGGDRSKNKNITKGGNVIICDWYNVTLKDANGNVIGVASLADDITERVNSKLLLEKSEKKYRDLFEKSVDPVFLLKDGVIVNCNASSLKLFGYPAKDALVKIHPSKISPEIQPNGQDSLKMANEMIKVALDKGSNRFRWYHKKMNGTVFPTEVTLTKIGEDPNGATIHSVVKDISEKVKKEQIEDILYNISRAALTIDNFKEFGYFIKDELQKIIDTNNFYIALYSEENDTFYTPIMVDEMEVFSKFPAKGTLTSQVLQSKKSLLFNSETHNSLIEKGTVELVGVDSKVWLGVPLKSQNKVFGAMVVQSYTNEHAYNKKDVQLLEFVADQISSTIQRKNSNYDLKIALKKAQESDRLKSAFLANMSHEIRTPMNGIIGFSELFLNPELSYVERKEYAKIVINSSRQLLSIVNDILDISKIEAGVVKLNSENVNINKLLNNLETFYLPIAQQQQLELKCEKGLKNDECTIKIDKTKLNQVISNLVSNAFKFTDHGSIEFGYELVNGYLKFYVKDTGVGIDEKLHNVIFDRFIQAEEDFEKQNKGTGLGLAISKKFVELFNGEIWLNSSKEGTTVFFTIPYAKVKEKMVTSVIEKTTRMVENNMKITILVAEDEEYNMLYINELFSKTNYKIVEASNGLQAVDLAKSNSEIKLVLMDIKMPVMNGIEAMKEIKQVRPNLPIIALSAFAMESDKENALANGFNSYLSKPIDKKLLFNLIQEHTK